MGCPDLCLSVSSPAGVGEREWLVANGLGGYASGRLGGGVARRHDGVLVAALPGSGRTILLDRIDERVRPEGGEAFALFDALCEFRLEDGLPVWRFRRAGLILERRVVMPWRQNTTMVLYRHLAGTAAALEIRPWIHVRGNDGPADQPLHPSVLTWREGGRIEIVQGGFPPVRLMARGDASALILNGAEVEPAYYPIEAERDYTAEGTVWSPGSLGVRLAPGASADLVASAEPWAAALAQDGATALAAERERRRRLIAQAHPAARDPVGRQLVLAADAFLFEPRFRFDLAARVLARGEQACSVIAGYPWFNDWGRDTMIALEGLTLLTGRPELARSVLTTFADYERDGLIPNNIPDGGTEGVYHAADATLWFFHALDRTVAAGGGADLVPRMLPVLRRILAAHRAGTRFGIRVDPADGLLVQGAEGVMLTWMDSDTPRRGKAVEINALWYNALCLMARWLAEAGDGRAADQARAEAERVARSFNRRFWNPACGHLFDLVDGETGDDPACRCNQILAIALPHPVLDPAHWGAVLGVVDQRLLTPFGLRSLDPAAADYRPAYAGNLASRDFAYHRGTVWPWLIGPFVTAWLRVHPDDQAGARRRLAGFARHLSEFCVGTIAEVFDGAAPHHPRGCTAQAWSVAELLRAWVESAPAMASGQARSQPGGGS